MKENYILPLSYLEEQVVNIVEDLVLQEACELVSVQILSKPHTALVRLYIDGMAEHNVHNAVGLDKLSKLNRLLGDVLDVADAENKLFPKGYLLEVSSPGLDKPLSKLSHFHRYVGNNVALKTDGLMCPKKIEGKLIEILSSGLKLLVLDKEEVNYQIPWQNIQRANLVYSFEDIKQDLKTSKKKKKNNGAGKWK